MDISANNIPYWMVEQTVPYAHENTKVSPGQKNKRISKVEPSDKAKDQEEKKLEERDREVRQHEEAHKAAAGAYARGGPNYTFQTGKSGKQYAIGGSVQIDASKEDTPEKTITKMQTVIAAAKAPAEPSAQDIKVAAEAAQTMQEARQELAEKHQAEKEESSPTKEKLDEAYKGPKMTNTFSATA